MSHFQKSSLILLALAGIHLPATAETVAINSPSFDFVRRVNYGSSTIRGQPEFQQLRRR